jgi:polysaccharide export outer membrane protein
MGKGAEFMLRVPERRNATEYIMRKRYAGTNWVRLLLPVICVFVSTCMWTQNGSGAGQVNSSSNKALAAGSAESAAAPLAAKPDSNFVIGVDDVLAINVWKEPDISRSVPVRSDGKISLPLVGELQASGETPKKLEAEIAKRLQQYISEPEVTVIVQEVRSQKFNVLGMVIRPGSYSLTKPTTVLDGIALAGGFRDFAKQKDIYVLRPVADGTPKRLPFNYKDVVKGRNPAQNIVLESNDTIVVP